MGKEILDLRPKAVWKHFYALTQIPRPSRHEQEVINYIKHFAEQLGLESTIDEVGNIIVIKPASMGMDDKAGLVLQAHVDMVPQKNNDKTHNFETDSIETIIDGDWLRANQTTLGADNGIGAAAMLAVLEDRTLKHGSIECLFTINEEAGMEGAFGLKPGLLNGNILLNLDSEDEGELFLGCAGGLNTEAFFSYPESNKVEGIGLKIKVSGLKGGHSGLDIALGRGNSNKILGRILWSSLENFNIQVATIAGGSLRNAIPREGHALIAVKEEFKDAYIEFLNHQIVNIAKELAFTEPNLSITIEDETTPREVISENEVRRIIGMLNAAPNGVVRMSDSMPGTVETSLNLAIVNIGNGKGKLCYLIRSFSESAKYALGEQVIALHSQLGCEVKCLGDYPGWQPNIDSYILKVAKETYNSLYGSSPKTLAIHAGLECGIIGANYPGMDMISFGPTIRFPHSPDEKVHIGSVDKFYTYLLEILEAV